MFSKNVPSYPIVRVADGFPGPIKISPRLLRSTTGRFEIPMFGCSGTLRLNCLFLTCGKKLESLNVSPSKRLAGSNRSTSVHLYNGPSPPPVPRPPKQTIKTSAENGPGCAWANKNGCPRLHTRSYRVRSTTCVFLSIGSSVMWHIGHSKRVTCRLSSPLVRRTSGCLEI